MCVRYRSPLSLHESSRYPLSTKFKLLPPIKYSTTCFRSRIVNVIQGHRSNNPDSGIHILFRGCFFRWCFFRRGLGRNSSRRCSFWQPAQHAQRLFSSRTRSSIRRRYSLLKTYLVFKKFSSVLGTKCGKRNCSAWSTVLNS